MVLDPCIPPTSENLRIFLNLCTNSIIKVTGYPFYRKLKLRERKFFALFLASFCPEARFEKTAWRRKGIIYSVIT